MYQHTQIGWGIILVLGLVMVLMSFTTLEHNVDFFVYAILLAALIMFAKLKITVDKEHIRLVFGLIGYPRRKFKLADIESCHTVKNIFFAISLGIHYGLKESLYNVSGPNAVALVMRNGRKVNIGADEPEKLRQAIQSLL